MEPRGLLKFPHPVPPRGQVSMRPVCVSAKPCDTDVQLRQLLQHRHRVALRLIMIWLSLQGWPPAQIAAVLQIYASAPVIALVCDNGIIHHGRATRAWLAAHPGLRVLYGARYSPHHNPVERIWAVLKAYLANGPTATLAGRIGQVHAFFGWSSPAQLLATAAPTSSPWLPQGYAQNFRRAAERPTRCNADGLDGP